MPTQDKADQNIECSPMLHIHYGFNIQRIIGLMKFVYLQQKKFEYIGPGVDQVKQVCLSKEWQ